MADGRKPLSPKERDFINAYLSNGRNGKAAAIAAGYAQSCAKKTASQILRRPHVESAIRRREKKAADRAQVTAERITEELAKIGFAIATDVASWGDGQVHVVPSDQIDEATAAAIASVKVTQFGVEVKMHDKLAALEKLGRSIAMFTDNVNVKQDALQRIREKMEADDGDEG